jgi:tetratricopeptide (TPR) repeat protein
MEKAIEHIIETLKDAKENDVHCSLLIGAGCSVTAGIPDAAGLVQKIQECFPVTCRDLKNQDYPSCMAGLSEVQRRNLINKYIKEAKINWAHIAIAQLMKREYVDRILTTNFDPLVIRACSMLGEFPAVYDFAVSQDFNPAFVAQKAIFHLHGQHNGFKLLHKREDCEDHAKLIGPVFEDAGKRHVWIVCGYSGESDPVFECLCKTKEFNNNLYWICYKDSMPKPNIMERLIGEDRRAFYIRGYDADTFFIELALKLGCFPPGFVEKPFSHLNKMLDEIKPFVLPGVESGPDILDETREMIKNAVENLENAPSRPQPGRPPEDIALKMRTMLMSEKYDEIISMYGEYGEKLPPEAKDSVFQAFVMGGNALLNQGKLNQDDEADRLLEQSIERYKAALKIKPNMYGVFYNWGLALSYKSVSKQSEEAFILLEQAIEKYKMSCKINPYYNKALHNWGLALSNQAKLKQGEEIDSLFEQAYDKYEATLKTQSDMHEALVNWGSALSEQAKKKHGFEQNELFEKARKKLYEAEGIKPGSGSYNLACIAALKNEEEECEKWLMNSYDFNVLPSREHIDKDTDLKNVRDKVWFKELIGKLK